MGKNKRSASKQPSSEPHSSKKRRGNSTFALTEHLSKASPSSSAVFEKPARSLVEAHKTIPSAPLLPEQQQNFIPPHLSPLYGYTCSFTPYNPFTESTSFTLISDKDAPERVKVDVVLRGSWASNAICEKLLRRQNRRIEFSTTTQGTVAKREPGHKTPLQLIITDQFVFRVDGDHTVHKIPASPCRSVVPPENSRVKEKARKSEGAALTEKKQATESHAGSKRHSLPSGPDPESTIPRDALGQAPVPSTSALSVPKVTSEPLFPSASCQPLAPPPASIDNLSMPHLHARPTTQPANAPRRPYSPSQVKEIQQSMQAFEATGLAKEDPLLTSSGEQSAGQQSKDALSQMVSRPQEWSPPEETVERNIRQVQQRSPQKQKANDRYVGLNVDSRVYLPRKDVMAKAGRINYIGAVVRPPIGRSVKGSETNYYMSLFLCDETGLTSNALNCGLFGKKDFLPLEIEVGDVLLLRDIQVQTHGGRPQLVMKSNERLDFAYTSFRLQGTPQGDKRRYSLRFSRDFDLSRDEKNAVRSVGRWYHNMHESDHLREELKKAHVDKINAAPGPRKQKAICQLEPDGWFDLVAEVQYADFARYNPTGDPVGTVDLLLCDYTTHDQLYDRPQSESEIAPAGKLSLKVTCWDRQATQAAKLWHPRELSHAERQRLPLPIVRISNGKSKLAGNHILEANVRYDSSKPERLPVEQVDFGSDMAKEILERKERHLARAQAQKAAALAAMPVTVPAQCNLLGPEVSLANAISETQVDQSYRSRVRVRDYIPRDLNAWIKNYCPKCMIEQTSLLEGRCAVCSTESARALELALLLEAADEGSLSVPVIVSDGEAMKLFGVEDVEDSPSELSIDSMAEALAPLFGMTAAEVKAGQTIVRSPTFTAGLVAFAKEGQRRLFLVETTLRTSEDELR